MPCRPWSRTSRANSSSDSPPCWLASLITIGRLPVFLPLPVQTPEHVVPILQIFQPPPGEPVIPTRHHLLCHAEGVAVTEIFLVRSALILFAGLEDVAPCSNQMVTNFVRQRVGDAQRRDGSPPER